MKRLALILMAAITVLVSGSCSKESPAGSGGITSSGIRFPFGDTYTRGDEIVIIGSGFTGDCSFILTGESGTIGLTNVTVTPSGVYFNADVPAGTYVVSVIRDGITTELGTITVTVAQIDVTVSEVPEYCLPGGRFTVSGIGFDGSARLVLERPEGERIELDTEASQGSLSATAPEDGWRGQLSLIIVQDNGEKTASETFFITPVKRLMSVCLSSGSGESAYTRELNVVRDESGTVTGCTEYTVSSEPGSDADYGEYTRYSFDVTPDAYDSYGYVSYRFKVGEDNLVKSYSFQRDNGEYREISWEYSSSGYLIYYGQGTSELYEENGNINQFGVYSYDNAALVNNPFAADLTLTILSSNDIQLLIAIICGFAGEKSSNLPTAIEGNSKISYTFDGDGYLTEVSYTESNMPVSISYRYE